MTLSLLEIFFIATAVISLFFNISQWRDRRKFYVPFTNSLVALFNDLKNKSNALLLFQNTLFNPKNPHTDIQTLRWEFAQLLLSLNTDMQGFQESVVGLLVTLNPGDREGEIVFRAQEYGLTEQERELRKKHVKIFQERFVETSDKSEEKKDFDQT